MCLMEIVNLYFISPGIIVLIGVRLDDFCISLVCYDTNIFLWRWKIKDILCTILLIRWEDDDINKVA